MNTAERTPSDTDRTLPRTARAPSWHRALRRLWRLPWLCLHLLLGLPLAVMAQTPGLRDRRLYGRTVEDHLSRWWCRTLLRVFGIRLTISGEMPPGVLLAANHQSWLDIFVLLAAGLMRFVAKAEIRGWPLAGWIVTRARALYLERGQSQSTVAVLAKMRTMIAHGERLAIFPEGGAPHAPGVHRFHSRLFAPAASGLCPAVPAAIRFTRGGQVSEEARFRPGEHVLGNGWRLLGGAGLRVEVHILPALPAGGDDRRALARAAEAAVKAAWSAPVDPG